MKHLDRSNFSLNQVMMTLSAVAKVAEPNTYLSLLGLEPIDNAIFYRNERREYLLADSL